MSVKDAFLRQSKACAALGSPFMGRLMALCAARLTPGSAVADRVLGWQGDPGPSADSVPLRLAGALHALKLEDLALVDVYPPNETPDDLLWSAVEAAFQSHETHLLAWLGQAPQTNEIRRSGVLIAAMAEAGARYPDLDVDLLELGASAGLNLSFDRYQLATPGGTLGASDAKVRLTPDWSGPVPKGTLPRVIGRKGTDLNPLDPSNPKDRLRLLAYLWADQPERRTLTEAAFAEIASTPAEISRMDAGDWLARQLADPAPDRLRVVMHTVAWQYFPETTSERALQALRSSPSATIQIGMEADGQGNGAGITLTHWPDGRIEHLGRADFHGRWITWH